MVRFAWPLGLNVTFLRFNQNCWKGNEKLKRVISQKKGRRSWIQKWVAYRKQTSAERSSIIIFLKMNYIKSQIMVFSHVEAKQDWVGSVPAWETAWEPPVSAALSFIQEEK